MKHGLLSEDVRFDPGIASSRCPCLTLVITIPLHPLSPPWQLLQSCQYSFFFATASWLIRPLKANFQLGICMQPLDRNADLRRQPYAGVKGAAVVQSGVI